MPREEYLGTYASRNILPHPTFEQSEDPPWADVLFRKTPQPCRESCRESNLINYFVPI